jgi:hypothetical protein
MSSAKTKQKTADAINVNDLQPTSATQIEVLTGAAFDSAARDTAIATEIAPFALAGHVVHKGRSRDFIVSKYDTMTKYCEDFAELQAFSRRIGVTK